MVDTQGDIRPQNASFVMRLWLEPTDSGSPVWRWRVHHVQSGVERSFNSLGDLLDFVGETSEVAPPVGVSFGEPRAVAMRR